MAIAPFLPRPSSRPLVSAVLATRPQTGSTSASLKAAANLTAITLPNSHARMDKTHKAAKLGVNFVRRLRHENGVEPGVGPDYWDMPLRERYQFQAMVDPVILGKPIDLPADEARVFKEAVERVFGLGYVAVVRARRWADAERRPRWDGGAQ